MGTTDLATVQDVRRLALPRHEDVRGLLIPVSPSDVPIEQKRSFFVFGVDGVVRGRHAHYLCTQVLILLGGKLLVTLADGTIERSEELTVPGECLVIPPAIWSSQLPLGNSSSWAVLSDRDYEPGDYIHTWEDFLALRRGR